MPTSLPPHRPIFGYFPCFTTQTMLGYRSHLARDYAILLDFDPLVVSIESPSLAIPYQDGRRVRMFRPDFLIQHHTRSQPVLAFCLSPSDHQGLLRPEQVQMLPLWCADQDLRVDVITYAAIYRFPRFHNIQRLRRFAPFQPTIDITVTVLGILSTTPTSLTIRAHAHAMDAPTAVAMHTILSLAYHQHVLLPIDTEKISDRSPVVLSQGEYEV